MFTEAGAAPDKPAGVVAITFADLRRRGVIDGMTLCDVSGSRVKAARETMAAKIGGVYKDMDLTMTTLPADDVDFDPDAFKAAIAECQGMLISTPEYNHSISSALKNIIDWGSRPNSKEDPAPCFPGKTAAVMSCSPGRLGGIRCLEHLRGILHNTGIRVIHEQYAMPGAHEAFAEDGSIIDERIDGQVRDLGTQLVRITSLLNPDA